MWCHPKIHPLVSASFAALVALTPAACAKNQQQAAMEASVTGPGGARLTDYGTTTHLHGQFTNAEARQRFLKAYQQRTPGQWTEVFHTQEGAPLSYKLLYGGEGSQLRVIVDQTQDKFGTPGVFQYTCEELAETDAGLHLRGCTRDGQVVNLHIP